VVPGVRIFNHAYPRACCQATRQVGKQASRQGIKHAGKQMNRLSGNQAGR
jgi:hypothetical protein